MNLSTTNLFKKLTLNSKNTNLIKLNNEQLKKIQSLSLSIADDIIAICEEYNLNYHLTGGTALGAVRHNGFIPWDDDIDIDIVRKDYNKLIEILKEKYSDKYFIHNPKNTEGFSTVSTNIRLKGTIVRGCNDTTNEQCGVNVDVVVIENTFNSAILRKIHGFGSLVLGFIASCRKFTKNKDFLLDLAGEDKEARKIFKTKIIIGRLFGFLSVRKWNLIYDKWNSICKNNSSKYVAVPTGRNHFFGELYERKDFCESTKHVFEGRNWNIPKEYDKYLTHMYGDYMKIPDEQHRESHVLVEFKIN